MKINRPYVIDLCVGQPRLPEQGDADVLIPPTVVPVLLGAQPLNAVQGSVALPESGMTTSRIVSNNQAQQQVIIATLPPGLWELEFTASYIADFKQTLTGADLGVRLSFVFLGGANSLIEAYIDNTTFWTYGRCRVLIKTTAQLRHDVQATGVAEHVQSVVWVNAIRII